jgi:hypothetical protein
MALNVLPPGQSGDLPYAGSWYSYVTRQLAEQPRDATPLWAALDAAGRSLAAEQGPDRAQWREDATKERLSFGFLPLTACWTSRPTSQQVITFSSHRALSRH